VVIKTRDFGYVEVNQEDILVFNEGVPGFENLHRYVLLSHKDIAKNILWMQSVDEAEICFIVISPTELLPDYNPLLPQEVVRELKISSTDDFRLLVIATIPENNIKNMSLNLKSPIVINAKKGLAKQVILQTDEYPLRYYYFNSQNEGEKKNACC